MLSRQQKVGNIFTHITEVLYTSVCFSLAALFQRLQSAVYVVVKIVLILTKFQEQCEGGVRGRGARKGCEGGMRGVSKLMYLHIRNF